ncbi:MAG: glycosyltransferase family 4 protein [Betaproteobacteria bacterium]
MRIALVRQRYNPYGGAERFVERALPALEKAGAEVTLIARSAQGWGDGSRKVVLADPFHLGGWWRDRSFARAAREAWTAGGFDLVQSHERIPGCSIYRAGDGVHRNWLGIRRGLGGRAEKLALALNPYHRYVCAAERAMFEHPALRAVICNSGMVRDEIAAAFRISREKLHVIYNGIDLEQFHPRERARSRAATRAELGVVEGETLFLFVGSGFARKGLDAAIGALAQCASQRFRLVVAGRDRQAARFAGQARAAGLEGRVQFVGGREDVRPLYAAADCFILPTRYDPFPNTALEALAMGLPVIVGRRCGAAEVVQPGRSGWICDPADIAGVASLMRGAAVAGAGMATAARACAENFGIEKMAGELVALYSALGPAAGRG